mgnify:CR=1 FL=1|jgi:hypothetical protein|tara:strand:+ start:182 stop:451 length:270 start_codon:yes stop_codon:yes gene_type:complete
MSQRTEALMRIVVAIVSGILLGLWRGLIQILGVYHFFHVLISGKRIRGLADFSEIWNTQIYRFLKYMTFVSNKRPFPFEGLGDNVSEFE